MFNVLISHLSKVKRQITNLSEPFIKNSSICWTDKPHKPFLSAAFS